MTKHKILDIENDYENLFVRIHKDKKSKLRQIAKKKGKQLSTVVRELIDDLIEKDK
jgi:predicted DNA-binding protein